MIRHKYPESSRDGNMSIPGLFADLNESLCQMRFTQSLCHTQSIGCHMARGGLDWNVCGGTHGNRIRSSGSSNIASEARDALRNGMTPEMAEADITESSPVGGHANIFTIQPHHA